MKLFRIMLLWLCAAVLLAGCALVPARQTELNQPTAPPTEAETIPEETETETETETEPDPRLTTEHLDLVVTETTISQLEEYPNLKSVDLSGSTCYTAIVVYSQNHPEVDVTFQVDFGGEKSINRATDLELDDTGVDFDLLLRNLIYVPHVRTVHLPQSRLTAAQIQELETAYPDVLFTYSVLVQGMEVNADTEELDLSDLTPETVDEVAPALGQMRGLQYVELMNESGECALSKKDVKKLVDAAPGVKFHYMFKLFGKTISTTDPKVEFKNLNLDESAEDDIRLALSIMTGCDTFILDECGLDNDLLAAIREDFPNTELAWRVHFGKYTTLTNVDTIRAVYNVYDNTCNDLRYCRGVKYMDIGHNETLTDLSFVADLPNLEILIASGCAVSDLTGFENCKNLEFLELAYCAKISDLSPLAGCSNLKYLNICYTKVSSLMPLDGLPMELLFCKRTQVGAEEQKVFKELHEDCVATFIGKEPYAGPGWRYVDNGKTFTEIYKKVREVFNYDAADKLIQAGSK